MFLLRRCFWGVIFALALAACQQVNFRSPALKQSAEPKEQQPSPEQPVSPSAPKDTAPKPQTVSSAGQGSGSLLPRPQPPTPPQDPAKPEALRVGVLRFEQDSWFKVCFWLTRDGQSSDSSFIGCNKGDKLLGTIRDVELPPASTGSGAPPSACSNLGVKAEVYRNTENCNAPGTCADASYPKTASFVRTTAMAAGPGLQPAMHPFLVRVGGDGATLDSRVVLTPELRRSEEEWASIFAKGAPAGMTRIVRVIFEDQTDDSFALSQQPTADWQRLGLDFNDVVFDLELRQSFGFERTSLACPVSVQNK
jgi:hypothetical protein